MNDIALLLPALALSLFCLIGALTARRELYFPLPKGLTAKLRDKHTVFLAVLCVLVTAAAVGMAEALGAAGPLRAIGIASRVVLLCLFALYTAALPQKERASAFLLGAAVVLGVLVRLIWSAPVELFFAAVSAFGCMAMLERRGDGENRMSDRFRRSGMVAVTLTFLMVAGINAVLLLNLTRAQSDEIGRVQLDAIRGDLQDTLSEAEAKLLHTAIRAEQMIDADDSRAALEHFILDQRESLLADESFMNLYIAGSDWHFVPDFDAPPDFHAAERVWYIGAVEHPGEVYLTEPCAEAYNRAGGVVLRDYSGHFFSCLSRRAGSGFTVMAAIRWWSTYGNVVLILLAFIALFGVCIVFIVSLINRLIRWQEGVNRQLVQAAEMAESANRAKSQFLSQMSHEIRTPMNAIIGLDSIALRDSEISPRTRDELEKIGASARHLLALINDILDMSRIESGRMELNEKDFSLREFLEQINVIVGGQCEDKGLRYECRLLGEPDEHFVGDDLKLKQILINILGNSVKFTERPGSVLLNVEELERREGRCRMRFTVTDTGIGMDKAFLSKLFEAFSQENDTSTNKYGGSGLGMAITKRMVDMMGGEILVESEKGVGSTFTVTIPLGQSLAADAPKDATEQETPKVASVAGLHVLIAEDQEMNAEVLTDLLDMEEITCEWAQNGKLAVELFAKCEENHFDAVLMDMRMPVMDGLVAARAIRALDRRDAKTVPIIALTANAFEEDVQQCLSAGMNEHLSKPVDIDLLTATLGRLIAGGKQ